MNNDIICEIIEKEIDGMKAKLRNKNVFLYLLFINFIIVLFFLMGYGVNATYDATAEGVREEFIGSFSNKTEKECVEFILDKGITIPEDFIEDSNLGKIVKDIIIEVENDPKVEFFYNYNVTQKFAEDIKAAVLPYCNLEDNALNYSMERAVVSELPNNTMYGEWQDDYGLYNCYAYALNDILQDKTCIINPGQISNERFNLNLSIEQMADLVKKDLITLGVNDIYITTERPTILSVDEKLICMRKGERDYHFMKYHPEGDFWTHKPGGSAILKYNHQPSNDNIWWLETINEYGEARVSDNVDNAYTSEIYYIIYNWEGFYIDDTTITGFERPTDFNGEIVIPAGITMIGTSVFSNRNDITKVFFSDLVIIDVSAFENCISLSTLIGGEYIYTVGEKAFRNCPLLSNVGVLENVISVGEEAFAGCDNLKLEVLDSNPYYSSENNILYNKTRTKIIAAGDVDANITIPKTVTKINDYTFSYNSNLEVVHIYGNPLMGNYAFSNCENLEAVYFYSYTVPEMGLGVFAENAFTLYVPYSKQIAYNTEIVGATISMGNIPIEVIFIVDEEIYGSIATYYGANISNLFIPSKEGYNFNNWIDDNGNIYQNGGVWDSIEDLTIEATWSAKQYYIFFDDYGSDEIREKVVTYDAPIGELPNGNLGGYDLLGWKDGVGQFYTADIIWNKTSNLTLFADYKGVDENYNTLYNVELIYGEGMDERDSVIVAYSSDMPKAIAPSREGYIFQGYFTEPNGKGVKYYNADMTTARRWDIQSNETLYAHWKGEQYIVTFVSENDNGVEVEIGWIFVEYGAIMPMEGVVVPKKKGYTLNGFYDSTNNPYYIGSTEGDSDIYSDAVWDKMHDDVLYAHWDINEYTLAFNLYDSGYSNETITVKYGDTIDVGDAQRYVYNRVGYDFQGFYSGREGSGVKYFGKKIVYNGGVYCYELICENKQVAVDDNDKLIHPILYGYWTLIEGEYTYEVTISNADEAVREYSINLKHGNTVMITAPNIEGYTFEKMWVNGTYYETSSYQLNNVQLLRELGYGIANYDDAKPFYLWYPSNSGTVNSNQGGIFMVYKKNEECIAQGSLITLADGTQVPVESLTGNERLLVWNLYTGRFDTAPILFIDHDSAQVYKIINLYFSDGTHVKVISEHAFWDFNLNKYVFLRADAGQYVGHWFNKQTTDELGNMAWGKVQLTNVVITEEYTTAWSPVTYGHLCIYVNGMLSMPGATEGLINIFEVDGETMQINQEQYLVDIETYGLFTYEEFAEIYAIPEEIFEAFNGQYLKVSIGKGLIDYETLGQLIETYSQFFV